MKYAIPIIFSFLFFTIKTDAQILKKPAQGKSLVYIMRSVDLAGAGLNFRIYDKDRFLGALPSKAYFTYECEPGEHLFWAASENRDFVEANLEANKTYVIDAKSKVGLLIAAVGLEPYEPSNKRHAKRINRVLRKHVNAMVAPIERTAEKEDNIKKALAAYDKIKDDKYSKISKLLHNMNFENE